MTTTILAPTTRTVATVNGRDYQFTMTTAEKLALIQAGRTKEVTK